MQAGHLSIRTSASITPTRNLTRALELNDWVTYRAKRIAASSKGEGAVAGTKTNQTCWSKINEKEENPQDWVQAQIRVKEAQKWSARRETN